MKISVRELAQSVKWLAMGWTAQGSNLDGCEIFCFHLDGLWGPPSLLYWGYWVSFPGLKQLGHVDHPLPSSAAVNERVELYLYSPCRSSCLVLGWTLHCIMIALNAIWMQSLDHIAKPLIWSLFVLFERGHVQCFKWLVPMERSKLN
jgi:hypothetical protein